MPWFREAFRTPDGRDAAAPSEDLGANAHPRELAAQTVRTTGRPETRGVCWGWHGGWGERVWGTEEPCEVGGGFGWRPGFSSA